MASVDFGSVLQEQLRKGTEEIYKKYQELIDRNAARTEADIKTVEEAAENAKRNATATSRLNLKSILESLASKGLGISGESAQARLVNGAGLVKAHSTLDAQKEKDKTETRLSGKERETELETQKLSEAGKYRSEMTDKLREQANADREYELEKEKARQENAYRAATLKLQQEKAAAEEKRAQEKYEESKKITPNITPIEFIEEVELRHTDVHPNGVGHLDVNGTARELYEAIQDPRLSDSYAYELYFYAKSMGYLE